MSRRAGCGGSSSQGRSHGGARDGARRVAIAAVLLLSAHAAAATGSAQSRSYPLTTTAGLRLHNVEARVATHDGKRGLRVTMARPSRPLLGRPTQEVDAVETLAVLEGVDFGSGVIEAEISGAPAPDAPEGARGFVGIAFRVRPDMETYDAFYLRPTNGRAEDQVRRNHSAQYISHPAWSWQRLRQETPKKYESYVDLVPGAWTRVRIEVRGSQARLYVHGQEQPTLIVNDLKTGADGTGAVALWIDTGTVAHFRNVRISR